MYDNNVPGGPKISGNSMMILQFSFFSTGLIDLTKINNILEQLSGD